MSISTMYLHDLLHIPAECIPRDHARQASAADMLEQIYHDGGEMGDVVDLGCGPGDSIDYFRARFPAARWIGVDIADSPEVRSRKRSDGDFRSFDGAHIPAADASVDVIFCKQALMYVESLPALFADVRRVLKPQGHFIGSTSQLECYTAMQRRNLTPYGLYELLRGARLRLMQVRPGIDAITLILRRLIGRGKWADRFWETESPLNRLIDLKARLSRKSAAEVNARKLLAAGVFCFWAVPDPAAAVVHQ